MRFRIFTVLFAAVLFLQGLALAPYPGIQNDEAFFGGGVYDAARSLSVVTVFKHKVPMMLISYLGALKSWVYAPILAIWKPSAYSVRIPVLLMGALTVALFSLLLERTAGRRAALIGGALLAFDTTFILATCFDWGPVALLHLPAVAGAFLLVRFHRTGSRWALSAAFLLFGLALWDKALFAWTLAGMAAGAVCAFPRELLGRFSRGNVALAVLSFAIGAFPLLRYNVQTEFESWRANVGYTAEGVRGKLYVMRSTFDGSGLFGYVTHEEPAPHPAEPRTALEKTSVALSRFAGEPRRGPLLYVFLGTFLLLPFLWRTPARRPMMFALVCAAAVWLQMLFIKSGGGSVHHAVLLWPWPHLFIAVGISEASRRLRRPGAVLAAALVVLVCGSNLLVTNEYLARMIRFGAAGSWTDASYPLWRYLEREQPQTLVVVDWGVLDTLRLLSEGRLPLVWGAGPLNKEEMEPADLEDFRRMAEAPEPLFLAHTDKFEEFRGVNARLRELSQAAGYRRETVQVISDRAGREVFELFRFRN